MVNRAFELYKLPKRHIQNEPDSILASMLKVPLGLANTKGKIDGNPFIVAGVCSGEWEIFLKVLFPLYVQSL